MVATLAARPMRPCIVACAGTMLTVDQLDEGGNFSRRAIVAGYHPCSVGWPGTLPHYRLMPELVGATRNTGSLATGAIDAMVRPLSAVTTTADAASARARAQGDAAHRCSRGAARIVCWPTSRRNSVVDSLVLAGVRLLANHEPRAIAAMKKLFILLLLANAALFGYAYFDRMNSAAQAGETA